MKKTSFIVAMLFATQVHAMSTSSQVFDPAAGSDCDQLEEARTTKIARDLPQWIPPNPNEYFGSGTCLDNILNRQISVIFSMPDLNQILGGLISAATNAACNVANQAVSKAMGNATQSLGTSIALPGGQVLSPGATVGTVYGSGSGTVQVNSGGTPVYSTPPINGTTTTQASSPSIIDRFMSIFR